MTFRYFHGTLDIIYEPIATDLNRIKYLYFFVLLYNSLESSISSFTFCLFLLELFSILIFYTINVIV
jgi:hypothetical protein